MEIILDQAPEIGGWIAILGAMFIGVLSHPETIRTRRRNKAKRAARKAAQR